MTVELTHEQIVTNLLMSDEILKPKIAHYDLLQNSNLGDYLNKLSDLNTQNLVSRYSFIDTENCWSF
ncbi:MAG: hypothetical protein MJ230_02670 [bacterium]|nr:hypothetical protein [bacterium]